LKKNEAIAPFCPILAPPDAKPFDGGANKRIQSS
jgi:hypothetical protein